MSRAGSPTHALILWDSRFCLDNVAPLGALTTESGYTEHAPIVPEPVAWGTDGARVYATGQPLTEAIEVTDTTGVADYRPRVGDDEAFAAPYAIGYCAFPFVYDGSVYNRFKTAHCCTNRLGDVVIAGSTGADKWQAIRLRDRAQQHGAFTRPSTSSSALSCVALLPDGRLVLLAAESESFGLNALIYESVDDGETWEYLDQAVFEPWLPASDARFISMAADGDGSLCLVVQDDDNATQLYSADGGLSWSVVGQVDDVRSARCFALANGGIGVCTLESGTIGPTDDSPFFRRLASAGQPMAASQSVEAWLSAAGASTSAALCGASGPNGRVYLYMWAELSPGESTLTCLESHDYGQTWSRTTAARGGTGGRGMRRIAAAFGADGVVLIGAAVDSDLGVDLGFVAYLGGWTGLALPKSTITSPVVYGEAVWYPWMSDLSLASEWTQPVGSDTTHTLTTTDEVYLAIGEETYHIGVSDTAIAWETSEVSSTLGTLEAGLEYRSATIHVQLRYFPDRIVVYDVVAASTLATLTLDVTERLQLYARINGVFLEYGYKRPTATVWTTGQHTPTTGSVSGTAGWRWGTYAAAGESIRVHWVQAGISGAVPAATSGVREPLPVWGQPAYGRGHVLRATAGLVRTTDAATLSPAYSHPLGAAFPDRSISPSSGWITEDDSQQQSIVFDFGAPIWVGDAVALAVLNARASTYFLAYYDGAAWQNVATLRLDSGFRVSGMTYASAGATIYPGASTTTADRWLIEGELAGGFALCGAEAIQILGNSAGLWASGSTGVRPTILLASAPSSATGDLRLCAPSGVAVAGLTSRTTARYWRVRVDNADASPGDQSGAGVIFVGRVLAFGAEPDWGWTEDDVPNVERANSPAGVPRQRALSLPLRRWGMSWSSGVLAWPIREGEDADYWSLDASHLPLVAVEDLRGVLRGALQTHQALPVIAVAGLADGTVTDPTLWVYGVLGTGGVGVRGVSGVEGEDEVYRVETLTVQEVR